MASNEVVNERAGQPLLNPVANGGGYVESSSSDATTTSADNHMPANGAGHVQHPNTAVPTVYVKNGSSAYKKVSSDEDAEDFYDRLGDEGLDSLELLPKGSGLLEQKSVKKEAIWNLVSTIIGGGILALPYVMGQAGLITSLVLFIVIGLVNIYTLQLLCDCGRGIRQNDMSLQRRIITYVMVAEKAYPGKWLRSFVLISIFLFCFMTVLGYFVALADIIPDIIKFFADDTDDDGRTEPFYESRLFAAIITLAVSLPLSLIRFIAKLWWLSLVAFLAIFILVLCVITRGFETVMADDYPNNLPEGVGPIEYARWDIELFSAISVITFAYTCHVNLFPVFSELKLSMSTNRKETMTIGIWAVAVSGFMYSITGIFGYLQFRDKVEQNIVESLTARDPDDQFLLVGQIGLVAMLTMSIILLGFPARRMMILLLRGTADNTPLWFEAIVSSVMLASAFGISLGFQQIGQIWSLAGAFLGTLIAFTLPCVFYLKLEKNNKWFIDRQAKQATFVIGLSLILMVIGTEEAIRDFVLNPPEF